MFTPGDFTMVTGYLDEIDASPSERMATALAAIQRMHPRFALDQLDRQDIDGLRAWARTQAPDAADRITGKALGEAAQGNRQMNFAAAAELAAEYSTTSGNDEALAAFLTCHSARQNKLAARELAARVSDEKRRAEILNFLK
jgi:hypothetical protein